MPEGAVNVIEADVLETTLAVPMVGAPGFFKGS
jgi:hypothetical protein